MNSSTARILIHVRCRELSTLFVIGKSLEYSEYRTRTKGDWEFKNKHARTVTFI